jgi:hypothetical protein
MLCFEDNNVRDGWIVTLSNGQVVYEDRPPGELAAWERLRTYCIENDLSIVGMKLRIGHLEIKMPSGQEGYVHKKRAKLSPGYSSLKICGGYVQGERALIHEVDVGRDSRTLRVEDPGPPWTIYRKDIRERRANATTNPSQR